MTNKPAQFVGTSFKLGYRFQNYWTDSMAIAFFAAEAGTGLFLVSYYFELMWGMILGVALAGTLKPYFHLAHMGVPSKAIRALFRPDRSWISRGALAIGFFAVPAIWFLAGIGSKIGMPMLDTLAEFTAVAAGLVVICYQGFAMSDSESFTLWASPFVPASSVAYALTAGSLLTLLVGQIAGGLTEAQVNELASIATILMAFDLAIVIGIINSAKKKSEGGRISVELLMEGKFAPWYRNLVMVVGLIVPIVIMLVTQGNVFGVLLSSAAMLAGFIAFRFLMFKAAVFEPITHDIMGKFGIS